MQHAQPCRRHNHPVLGVAELLRPRRLQTACKQASFAWAVLGGLAGVTERLRVGTGVMCLSMRTHPAIVAQAAATVATMMPGRFFLGVGPRENLNEHILAASRAGRMGDGMRFYADHLVPELGA